MKRILAMCLLGLVTLVAAQAQLLINGAGSTFDYPVFAKWFSTYAAMDPSVNFNYQSIGSGGGLRQIMAQTVDFGASDAPMTDKTLGEAHGKIFNLPVVVGGEAIVYTLPGSPKLRLDPDVVSGIYLGNIKKWNDPKIAALNPDTNLPATDIIPVHRSDGSGTTFIFTDYLCSISPEWKAGVGKGTTVNWPVGVEGKGNEGVAEQVRQLRGAIGYVELAYAKKNRMQYADLKNAAGNFVSPTLESVSAALATATIPDDFRFSMVNSPGENAYPISGASWILIYQAQKDAGKGKKLVGFIRWAVTEGQKISGPLDYAPIPYAVVQRILKRLDEVTFGN